ncbi:hypothetical protein BDV29DRAFT_112152 [Aspergillus leporis]|uniref:Uncharacterized protein n=1 Tax=Aspergillus leporis TaxID=41062 RepID=A0A5N5XJ34_9EURO|nr:hypothetical protein BDV29DRAFT_112152 [Aspergillus leporis]
MVKLHRHRTKIEFERWDWNKTTPIEFRPQPIHRPHSAEAGLLRPRETVSASIESQTSAQNTSAEGNESPTRSKGHRLSQDTTPLPTCCDVPNREAIQALNGVTNNPEWLEWPISMEREKKKVLDVRHDLSSSEQNDCGKHVSCSDNLTGNLEL